jgi:CRP-like cAMP-binding protein
MSSSQVDSYELLSGTGLAAGMSPEQVQVLSACGRPEVYADGENLVTKDDEAFDLLVVVEGKCEIRTSMNDVLYQLGPSSLIGEVSFLDHRPRSAKAIAIGQCKTIRFPASLLDDLEAARPDIVAKLLKNIGLVLCQKLRSTTRFAEASFI